MDFDNIFVLFGLLIFLSLNKQIKKECLLILLYIPCSENYSLLYKSVLITVAKICEKLLRLNTTSVEFFLFIAKQLLTSISADIRIYLPSVYITFSGR